MTILKTSPTDILIASTEYIKLQDSSKKLGEVVRHEKAYRGACNQYQEWVAATRAKLEHNQQINVADSDTLQIQLQAVKVGIGH